MSAQRRLFYVLLLCLFPAMSSSSEETDIMSSPFLERYQELQAVVRDGQFPESAPSFLSPARLQAFKTLGTAARQRFHTMLVPVRAILNARSRQLDDTHGCLLLEGIDADGKHVLASVDYLRYKEHWVVDTVASWHPDRKASLPDTALCHDEFLAWAEKEDLKWLDERRLDEGEGNARFGPRH